MTTLQKQISLAAITLVIGGAGILGVSTRAFAEDSNGQDTLVQKIAQKFQIDQAEVQAVFDEEHKARETEMEARHEAYLKQLVSEGKITEAQKQLLLQKHEEMRAQRPNREAMKSLSSDERKAQMDTKRQELDTWAKQNGIDPDYLMGPMMGKMHGRMQRVIEE